MEKFQLKQVGNSGVIAYFLNDEFHQSSRTHVWTSNYTAIVHGKHHWLSSMANDCQNIVNKTKYYKKLKNLNEE